MKLNRLLRDRLRHWGWDLQRFHTYRNQPDPARPWEDDPEFLALYKRVLPDTLLDRRRLYMLFQTAKNARTIRGDLAECGVFRGGSALLLSLLKPADKQLFLFDTFDGMPSTDRRRDFHRENDFNETSLAAVQRTLTGQPGVQFRAGFFPTTVGGLEDRVFALVHVDFDIYRSMMDACLFFFPRLARGGCIIFDDFGAPSCPGAREAILEFCAAHDASVLYLPTGQALMFNFRSTL